MKKRGQAAMEFLMTYGWVILIILVVIAALYYLGLFDSNTPATAQLGNGPISAQDIRISESGVRMTVKAAGVSTASVTAMSVDTIPCISTAEDISEAARSYYTILCPIALAKGKKVQGTIKLSYTPLSGISHDIEGTFSGEVEAKNPSTTPLKAGDIATSGGMAYTGSIAPSTTLSISAVSSGQIAKLVTPSSYTDVKAVTPPEALSFTSSSAFSPLTPDYLMLTFADNRKIKVFFPTSGVLGMQQYCIADDGSLYSYVTNCATLTPPALRAAP